MLNSAVKMARLRGRRPLILLLGALVLLAALLPASIGEAQVKVFHWERFDVDIQVQENGDLLVTERQVISFGGAPFSFGYRELPAGRSGNNDGIDQVAVREGDIQYQQSGSRQPHTFEVTTSSSRVEIDWYFPPALGNNSYELSYRVRGGVRTESSGDQVFWNALPADLGARVSNSTITIRLPEGIQAASTTARMRGSESEQIETTVSDNGRTVAFTLLQGRPAGDAVEVGVRFPTGQLAVETPGWQAAEQRGDVLNILVLLFSMLVLTGGIILVVLNWYLRGRDPEIGVTPDYLAQPPDDTPPAVVGTLIDETAHIHDIMSTLIHLAERGFLTMTETGRNKDYRFERSDKPLDGLRPFERKMIEGIFGKKRSRNLNSLRYKFAERLPAIRSELYKELEEAGFVRSSPESVRNRYGCFGFGLAGLGLLLTFVVGPAFVDSVSLAFCLPIAVGVVGIAIFIAGRYMPSKTQRGAEAAASWLAFKKYLENIEQFTNLEEATGIFEKYLAYAVAFGLERSWIRKFSAVPAAPIPPWYIPYFGTGHPTGRGRSTRGDGTGGIGGPGSSGGSGRPSLEGMSGGLAGGLAGMSTGLTRMLTNTQTVLQSTRSSSGSGGGGGFSGGFSGGSSGGGGGGFG